MESLILATNFLTEIKVNIISNISIRIIRVEKMKREDFKDFNEYEKACELKCIQFHETTRKYRLSKANSKSPLIRKFLLWFYGLEKVVL